MTKTHEDTKAMTAVQIAGEAAKRQKTGDAASVAGLWSQADALDAGADTKALTYRAEAWKAKGAILVSLLILAGTKADDLHTIGQQSIADAAKAQGIVVTADRAKRFVRANLYLTPALLTEAQDLAGTAKGPHTLDIMHVLRWCQAHHDQGWKALKGGTAEGATKAKLITASSHAAIAKADTKAKADADAAKAAKLTEGAEIIAAADDTVYGPLTAARWSAMKADDLDRVIAIAQGVKAAKAKAKADAPKVPKAKAKADLPGADRFAALVAAGVITADQAAILAAV